MKYSEAFGRPFILIFFAGCVSSPSTLYEKYKSGQAYQMFYKDGGTFEQIRSDLNSCIREATEKVPAKSAVGVSPTFTTPLQTNCTSNGYGSVNGYGYGASYHTSGNTMCTQTGGQTYGGGTYQYDANAGVRKQAVHQCMARSGNRLVNIPACPRGTDLSGQDIEPKFRPLSERTCYTLSGENGDFRVGEK